MKGFEDDNAKAGKVSGVSNKTSEKLKGDEKRRMIKVNDSIDDNAKA